MKILSLQILKNIPILILDSITEPNPKNSHFPFALWIERLSV